MSYTSCMRWGNHLLARGYDDVTGERYHSKIDFKPSLYIETDTTSPYSSIDGKTLQHISGMDMKRAKEFVQLQPVGSVYGMDRFEYQYTAMNTMAVFDKFRVMYLDIETECEGGFPDIEQADQEINLITMMVGEKKITIGTTKHGTMKRDPENINHEFYNCKTEDELISRFIEEWKRLDPDVVTGWNVNLFDLPYLYNRIEHRRGTKVAKKMSPWEVVQKRNVRINGRDQVSYIFYGINILDYLDLYKKYTYVQQPTYKLDYIASVELGTNKLSYDEHDSMHSFYKKDWEKFVVYNIKDVELVAQLEDKMQLIQLAIMSASDAHANPHDVFSQVRMWDLLIYNHLKDEDKFSVARVDPPQGVMDQYAGAFVKEPVPGLYDWVVTFDVSSMYPNAIRYLNISPETVVDNTADRSMSIAYALDNDAETNIKMFIEDIETAKKIGKDAGDANVCVSPTGDMFDKTVVGFLPDMMADLFTHRSTCKRMSTTSQTKADNAMVQIERRGLDESTFIVPVDGYVGTGDSGAWDDWSDGKLVEYYRFHKQRAKQYDIQQMAMKIALNSCYGSLGNQYSRYYDLRLATSITMMGQLSIRFVADRLNKKLNKVFGTEGQDYVAYIDTDSVHLKLETAVEQVVPDGTEQEKIKFLQKTGAGIGRIIKDAFTELGQYTNNMTDSMNMECEAISRKALWTGKKRYVLNVVADEDRVYPHAKNKIMGLEIKRSSTPDAVKPYIERSIELILAGDIHEFRKYINECKNEFYTLAPEDIAFPRGVSSISKFIQGRGYSKGTPIAVRAAILYNNLIEEKMVTDKYSHMTDGSKIKFLYLTMPNPIHENVIGFNNSLPKEFELDKYVDYDLQFNKTFIEPVEGLLKYIGWTIEEKITLF